VKNKLLLWIANQLPARIISEAGAPYLERYFLFQVLGYTFYLHRFVGSDPDRGLHDHPWKRAFSVLLSGWYFEHTRYGINQVRWLNALVGDSFHRVVLPDNAGEVWTLFAHSSAKVKPWGFLRVTNNQPDTYVWMRHKYEANEPDELRRWWRYAKKGKQLKRDAKGIAIVQRMN